MKIHKLFLLVFPWLFFADAVISVSDDLSLLVLEAVPLKNFREVFAYFVIFLTAPYLYSLFVVRPENLKRYLLLPFYNVIGGIIGAANVIHLISSSSIFITLALEVSPWSIVDKHPLYYATQLSLSLIQLVIAVIVLIPHLKAYPVPAGPQPRRLQGLGLSSLYLFAQLMLIIGIIPLILIAATKGFLGIENGHITSIEKVYKKGDKTVHLVPMIHVGDQKFYKEISQVDSDQKTLFLLEGVQDKNQLLKNLNYDEFASKLGLDKQGDHYKPQATRKENQKNFTYIVADIDVSEFSDSSREFLKTTFESFKNKNALEIFMMDSDKFSANEASQLAIDLMDKRNEKVLSEFKTHQEKFSKFYIPWGAAHMPDIERYFLKEGFSLVDTKERSVVSLEKVFSSPRHNK